MIMCRVIALSCVCSLLAACGSSKSDEPVADTSAAVTYYGDVVPILQDHCLQCHQQGGIAPIRLDDYETAKMWADDMADDTARRAMPPWSITSDGSCGEFAGSLALSDEQIATIGRWAKAGAKEGTKKELSVPALPSIGAATQYKSPNFTPIIQGGPLTAADEYRCFLLDSGIAAQKFITGYDVKPGNEHIVHHVLAFIVDPNAKTELDDRPNLTNGELMAQLDADTPDRDGWPCFGMAGDGVSVSSVPVVWAPGQGPVQYPVKSGVPLQPSDKIVIQIHYNFSDMSRVGESDQSSIQLRFEDHVERVGIFVLNDPFLDTLGDPTPAQLAPGKASVKYGWSTRLADFGLDRVPDLQLNGVMPHMHQLGRKYQLQVSSAGDNACAADVQDWDFHWQRMYFYDKPPALDAQTAFKVTCDYDTTSVSDPVLPGWGTSNEMCLATLYFTVPNSSP
ncbi:MAG TPA: hypothetical protein VFK05_16800 [Polyangiaceae bacterium]|nr:hypothetical protein [Polyangiaceae bacterium]